MRRFALFALTVAFAAAISGCKGPRLLSRDQEVQLGRQAGDEFERKWGLDPDRRAQQFVKRIGQRIAAVAKPPDYPYDYRVLRRKEVNATAFPGGRIYVWRGLLDALKFDEDQVAWVIGHETAHVARRHATSRLERALGYDLLISFLLGKEAARQVAGIAADLMLRHYSRDQEFEADRYGMLYAYRAGYDPTAAVAVLRTFQRLQRDEPSDFELLFATHPGNQSRINACIAYLRKQGWSGRYFRP